MKIIRQSHVKEERKEVIVRNKQWVVAHVKVSLMVLIVRYIIYKIGGTTDHA
jgi:hypothetical protein